MIIARHGGNPEKYGARLDFSSNINPFGMPERVKDAVIDSMSSWEEYPDPECIALRKKLSAFHYVPVENIVCGNGADELIYRIVNAVRPRVSVVCAPTFTEYKKALEEADSTVREFILEEKNGFAVTDDILRMLDEDTDMVFLCSPNNPTGRTVDILLLEKIVRQCQANGIFLVCDECFLDFVENGSIRTALGMMNENVIILRSFTKMFAMAGLRLGYAIFGDAAVAEEIQRSGPYWSVSAPAQAAGIAALDETDFVLSTVRKISVERTYLSEEMKKCWIYVYDSEANFILFSGIPRLDEFMLREGILIRNCSDYSGFDKNYYRIAVRTRQENDEFLEALRRVLNHV